MNDTIFMNVLHSWKDLMHEPDCLCFLNSFVLDDIVEEFPTFSIFHNQMNGSFCFNYLYFSVSTSYSWMMFGWRRIFRMHISLVTLSISDCSTILSFCKVFTATFWSVKIWMPRRTFPKVPSPILFAELENEYPSDSSRVFPQPLLKNSLLTNI